MFERYTERARRVLFFARYEASQLGSASIESEHLLLGLLREGKGLTSRLFAQHRVSFQQVTQQIESRSVWREKISTSVEIPFSADLKAILQHAADEADRLQHNYIGTEHLLLGILRAERSVAASILAGHGFALQSVRDEIVQLIAEKPAHDPDSSRRAVPAPAVAASGHVAGWTMHVPAYLPSEIVHFSFSTMQASGVWCSESPRHWHITGAGLATLIARAYRTEESRVIMPADLADDRRYDVALMLPADESADAVARRVQRAIADQFHIAVSREMRPEGETLVVRRA